MVVYHLPECFRNFGRNVNGKAILVFLTGKFPTGISEWKMCLPFEFSPVPSPTPILMRITCRLVDVLQMVHANLGRNFSLGIFAYHLYKPSTNRFSQTN